MPNATMHVRRGVPLWRVPMLMACLLATSACPPFSPNGLLQLDDGTAHNGWEGGHPRLGVVHHDEELDVVVADRQVAVDVALDANTSLVAYNPSMVPYGEGALMAFRLDAPARGAWVDMRIGLVALDANFAPLGPSTVLDLRMDGTGLHTAEDPRLVWHNDELYALFNQRVYSPHYFPRAMHLARIGLRTANGERLVPTPEAVAQTPAPQFELEAVYRLQAPAPVAQQRVEKNWSPFSLAGDLFLMYQTNPPVVLRLTDAMLHQSEPLLVPLGPMQGAPPVRYGYGEIRGGTGAVPARPAGHSDPNWADSPNTPWPHEGGRDDNALEAPWPSFDPNVLYESFFHAQRIEHRKRRFRYVYTIGYYAFRAAPPFNIARLLPVPLAVPGADATDPATFTCSYPGGFFRRGRYYHVAYGREDKAIGVLSLDAEALLAHTIELAAP